jgi:hypothetical protein
VRWVCKDGYREGRLQGRKVAGKEGDREGNLRRDL